MSKTYRILHCISSLHMGGAGRLLLRNLAQFKQGYFENFVCYLIPRHDLRSEYHQAGYHPIYLDHTHSLYGPRTVKRIASLIKEYKIDIVHTNLLLDRILGTLAATLVDVPVVTTLHTTMVPQLQWSKDSFYPWLRLRTIAQLERTKVSQFIAVAPAVRDAQVLYKYAPRERVTVVESGLSLEDLLSRQINAEMRTSLQKELQLKDAYPILVNVGRLDKVKGQRDLIPMMSVLLEDYPNARLLIIGEGGERSNLEQEIRQRNMQKHINLLGQRSDIPEILGLTDIALFPSHNEGLSLALLEAMGSGLPVIVSRIPAMELVVKDGYSGLLVDPKSSDALAKAVIHILADRKVAETMGQNGQHTVKQHYDISRTVKQLESVYTSVLEGRHK